MTKYFLNRTDSPFMFGEIDKKAGGKSVLVIEEIDLTKCKLLRELIKNGVFVEISEDQYEEVLRSRQVKVASPVQERAVPGLHLPDPYGLKKDGNLALEICGDHQILFDKINNSKDNIALDPRYINSTLYGMEKKASVILPSKPEPSYRTSVSSNNISDFGDINSPTIAQKKNDNIKDVNRKEVWWMGPAGDAGGYGKMNRECIDGLYKKGVKVQLHQPDGLIPDFRCLVKSTPAYEEMLTNQITDGCPSVWGIMPPAILPRPGKKFLFTMTETLDVPKSFATKCNNADELWLPSQYCMDAFLRAKEKGTIRKGLELQHMPLGVNTDLYKPFILNEEQKETLGIKTKGFVFLSLFGWSLRKGTDILFESYLKEFSNKDDVSLLIVSRKNGSSSAEMTQQVRDDIKKYISRWSTDGHPHIVHFGDAVQEEVLPLIYNFSDCFVLPSRGEGFSLTMAEAGATEKPVIATRCGGQLDFLNDDNSFLVDVEGYDVANQEIKSLSSYYENESFAVLGETAITQMREYMRYIYENQVKANEKGVKLREHLIENFTWNHLVEKVYKRLF